MTAIHQSCLLLAPLTATLLAVSCEEPADPPEPTAVGKDGWLKGTTDEKPDTFATHLRGNDLVMWEIEFRHRLLYQALERSEMDYARCQLVKIVLAMKLGAERRPARLPSYQIFFDQAVPPMQAAIDAGQRDTALVVFRAFTQQCVTCHSSEKLEYMPVARLWESPAS